jgi:hypothetical protein
MSSEQWTKERIHQWLKSHSPFSVLSEQHHEDLLIASAPCDFQPGEMILEQRATHQSFLWGVLEGEVRLFDDETSSMEVPVRPGQCFGVKTILRKDDPIPYSALSAHSTVLLRIPAPIFVELCEQNEEFSAYFTSQFIDKPNLIDNGNWVGGETASPYQQVFQMESQLGWGSLLDCGTGDNSLSRLLHQPFSSFTAITKDEEWAEKLRQVYGAHLREQDRLLVGEWQDESLLEGESFDAVLVDYVIGAIERTAPYFQYEFFERIKRHVKQRIYVIGLEPQLPSPDDRSFEQVIHDVYRLRAVCLLMAGNQPFREYPASWVLNELKRNGFNVQGVQRSERIIGFQYIHWLLNGCLRLLPSIQDSKMAVALAESIQNVRERAMAEDAFHWGVRFSHDYTIFATV